MHFISLLHTKLKITCFLKAEATILLIFVVITVNIDFTISFCRVFHMITQLRVLDNIPRLDSDEELDEDQDETTSSCVLS